MSGPDPFQAILLELGELEARKRLDYGLSGDPYASVRLNGWGLPSWAGAMIRASSKLMRIQAFARSGKLANEGVRDSFLDLAAYAIIGLILFEESLSAE